MTSRQLYFLLLFFMASLLFTMLIATIGEIAGYFSASLAGLPILVLSTYASAALVACLCAYSVRRRPLPQQFLEDVPDSAKTIVVIPCLLSSPAVVDQLIENLKHHYLRNALKNVFYVLLSDYTDADREKTDGDTEIINYVIQKIDQLNQTVEDVFGLLHRRRTWSSDEMKWMGRERKRGKLEDLNNYLLGKQAHLFDIIHCKPEHLQSVTYVLTVDADTQLPSGSVLSLIGVMCHPDNISFDLIQPGVRASPGEPVNLYQWIMFPLFPPIGIFQDLFGRAKYIGKGIYSVKRFRSKLLGRLPNNWVLSHDILESCFVKVGSADHVILYEGNPVTVMETMSRLHRWYRGDWQSIPWVLPNSLRSKIPEFRSITPAQFTAVEFWRLLELMILSLQAPAKLLLIFILLLKNFLLALIVIFSVDVVTSAAIVLSQIARGNRTVSKLIVLRLVARQLFSFLLLPSFARLALDAVGRAFFRMFISKKRRLEWSAFAEWKIAHPNANTKPLDLYANYIIGCLFLLEAAMMKSYSVAAASIALVVFPFFVRFLESTTK